MPTRFHSPTNAWVLFAWPSVGTNASSPLLLPSLLCSVVACEVQLYGSRFRNFVHVSWIRSWASLAPLCRRTSTARVHRSPEWIALTLFPPGTSSPLGSTSQRRIHWQTVEHMCYCSTTCVFRSRCRYRIAFPWVSFDYTFGRFDTAGSRVRSPIARHAGL